MESLKHVPSGRQNLKTRRLDFPKTDSDGIFLDWRVDQRLPPINLGKFCQRQNGR